MHRIRERGVGVWIWEEISRKALATSSTSQWIRLRFYQFRVQHALVIYTLLPVRIKTSNIDAAQRPGEIQETHAAGPRIRKIL
jgi:hypothetical protein